MVSLRGTCAELARLFSVVVPCVSKLSHIRRISIFNANSIPFLRQRVTLRLICSRSPILRLPVSGSPFQEHVCIEVGPDGKPREFLVFSHILPSSEGFGKHCLRTRNSFNCGHFLICAKVLKSTRRCDWELTTDCCSKVWKRPQTTS
jgi:hypothetical protein